MADHQVTLKNNSGYPSWSPSSITIVKGESVWFTLEGRNPYVWGFSPDAWTDTSNMSRYGEKFSKANGTLSKNIITGKVDQYAYYATNLTVYFEDPVPTGDPIPEPPAAIPLTPSSFFDGNTNLDDIFETRAENGNLVVTDSGYNDPVGFLQGSTDIAQRYYRDSKGYTLNNTSSEVGFYSHIGGYDLARLFAKKGDVHLTNPYFQPWTYAVSEHKNSTRHDADSVTKSISIDLDSYGKPPATKQDALLTYEITRTTYVDNSPDGTWTWTSAPTINSGTNVLTATAKLFVREVSGNATGYIDVRVKAGNPVKKSDDVNSNGKKLLISIALSVNM